LANQTEKRLYPPSAALCPTPVVLVTCGDYMGEMNAITVAWVGTVASEPPMIAIGIRPTRYSFGLLQRYGDFVVNLPTTDHVDVLNYCGTVSGRNEDKFKGAGITPARADNVRAPLVAEFPVNIECKIKNRIGSGSHDLFLGEVMCVHIAPEVLSRGDIDPEKMNPLAYFNGLYFALGDQVGKTPNK
jgi:flavin reductase (DIM6/NTAB) family NADH-FMN oxidoreductase RutF